MVYRYTGIRVYGYTGIQVYRYSWCSYFRITVLTGKYLWERRELNGCPLTGGANKTMVKIDIGMCA